MFLVRNLIDKLNDRFYEACMVFRIYITVSDGKIYLFLIIKGTEGTSSSGVSCMS